MDIKERKSFTIQEFLGVDFTTSPLKVDPRRAVSGVNFLSDYGTLKKRNGWIEQVKFIDKKINGLFRYTNFTIVRAGNKIYKLNDDMSYTTLYTIDERPNEQISFFVMNSKVYIVGLGKYLMLYQNGVDSSNNPIYVIDEVRNHATIPTTTISIDDEDSGVTTPASLDPVNLLSIKRKNTLLGRNSTYLTWLLDSGIRTDDVVSQVLVDIERWNGSELVTEQLTSYPDQLGLEHYLFDVNETSIILGNAKGEIIKVNKGFKTVYYWEKTSLIDFDDYKNTVNKITINDGTLTNPDADDINGLYEANYILWNNNDGSLGLSYEDATGALSFWILKQDSSAVLYGNYQKIKLYEDTTPPIQGADNITVTFETSDVIDRSGIENASCGIVFGVNGTTNQLFLAYKGKEFFSKAYDFEYFPDNQTNVLGNEENDILGYDRLSDTSLVIYKDSKVYESRLYFRTMELSGSQTTYETEYTLYNSAIDSNIGCDAARSIGNLAGDHLFLSNQGVYAVALGSNVSIAERHVKERSLYVNKKLLEEDISKGIAIVYDNYYFLAVNGNVYVADARFRTSSNMSDTFNYEFYFWNNIPVTAWIIIDNELWFGTDEGRICKFDDEFSDRTLIKASEGDVTLVVDGNYLVYNQAIEVKENDEIYADCYQQLLSSIQFSVTDGLITALFDVETIFTEGDEVYIKDISSNLTEEIPYYIYNLDQETFALKDASGSLVSPTGQFNILRNLYDVKMYVTNLDAENSQFQLKTYENGSPVTLVSYSLDPITFTIIVHESVVMSRYSPIFDLGTNMYSKTLLSMTISADASTTGEIKFGYDTRNISSNIQSLNYKDFTFDDIDFNNFTFLTAIASSYTKKVKEKDFNFIIIKFGSESPTSAVINSFTLFYKINQVNKGIR
ncbi:MAG: hypothetical protein AB7E61_07230 [Acholeplasmataceae bacterium]